MRKSLAVFIVTFGFFQPAAGANLLNNGGFELPPVTNQFNIPAGSTFITGWTVTQGNVDLTSTTFSITSYEGDQAVDLIGQTDQHISGQQGGLAQSFSTSVGQLYRLTFAYSHNFGAIATTAAGFTAQVSVTDSASNSLYSAIFEHNSTTNLPDWKIYTALFTALTDSTRLSFTNLTGGRGGNVGLTVLNGGIYLDNVIVEAVSAETPIPAALPLFATGLAGIGVAAYRRRRQQVR